MRIYLAGMQGCRDAGMQGYWIRLMINRLLSFWDVQEDQFMVLSTIKKIVEIKN